MCGRSVNGRLVGVLLKDRRAERKRDERARGEKGRGIKGQPRCTDCCLGAGQKRERKEKNACALQTHIHYTHNKQEF